MSVSRTSLAAAGNSYRRPGLKYRTRQEPHEEEQPALEEEHTHEERIPPVATYSQAGARESLLQTKESIIEYVTQHRPRMYHTIPQHAHELERQLEKEWWIAVCVCTVFLFAQGRPKHESERTASRCPQSFVSTVSQTAPAGDAPAKDVRAKRLIECNNAAKALKLLMQQAPLAATDVRNLDAKSNDLGLTGSSFLERHRDRTRGFASAAPVRLFLRGRFCTFWCHKKFFFAVGQNWDKIGTKMGHFWDTLFLQKLLTERLNSRKMTAKGRSVCSEARSSCRSSERSCNTQPGRAAVNQQMRRVCLIHSGMEVFSTTLRTCSHFAGRGACGSSSRAFIEAALIAAPHRRLAPQRHRNRVARVQAQRRQGPRHRCHIALEGGPTPAQTHLPPKHLLRQGCVQRKKEEV